MDCIAKRKVCAAAQVNFCCNFERDLCGALSEELFQRTDLTVVRFIYLVIEQASGHLLERCGKALASLVQEAICFRLAGGRRN